MSLFIAILIIYGMDMSPWLYPVAAVIWLGRLRAINTLFFDLYAWPRK